MKTRKLTALAMLTALSLVIFIIEAQLPPLAPVPGIKLGLANIVTLITLRMFGRREALCVLALRIVLGAVFTGQIMSLVYSVSGGALCFIVMALLCGALKEERLWVTSVFGAIAHNAGQLLAAVIFTRTAAILWYAPLLLISAILTGAFTGCLAMLILKNRSVRRYMK